MVNKKLNINSDLIVALNIVAIEKRKFVLLIGTDILEGKE
jgi:hypothetical protein